MSAPDRKEDQVRRLLEGPHPVVPAGLAAGAAARGDRLMRRRRALRRFGWTVLFAAAVAFTVWASLTHPWTTPPSTISPPLEGW
ncbi:MULTISPECIES: hypothetical protein [unclassified Streptomyces]|uniref:hypothetical protein n=1 Tax=unclassified Streptomyces TaxID=2593676 RepID=UPI001BE52206|nr:MULTISPECIES: hypothetical protein [unclassified Streptomyces]MBT2408051.1 hypothetical protein [Streptomyces sp. ISL-21]MBT2458869.1 hypothetical protein [Streptomyces sp. ISL-86]MBT2611401.1 hypothetical protein [Streptomyces sp. ISL-87]